MAPKRTVDQIIGDRIRLRRHYFDLTMDQLGKKIGVRFGMIHKIEHGQCKMTLDRIIKIAKALDTPLEQLLRGL